MLEALTAPHGIDRYLELVIPDFSLRDRRAEVIAVRHQSPRSVTLTLRPNEAWDGWEAGQFVPVTFEIDGVRRTRCYSPAGSAHAVDGTLELTIGTHDEGLVSRYLRDHAQAGLVLELGEPDGDFILSAERPESLLLISGGSGITPTMAILRTLCDEGHREPVTFIHFARTHREAVYAPALAAIARRHPNVSVHHIFTREVPSGTDPHFSLDLLRSIDPELLDATAYVCGPVPLLEAVEQAWEGLGRSEQFYSENFVPPPRPEIPAGEITGNITFTASAVAVANSGATLLETAEQAGLGPDNGCRMGICHTCTCRKLSGQVRNVYSGELSSMEAEDIQICVSVAAGDVEIEI